MLTGSAGSSPDERQARQSVSEECGPKAKNKIRKEPQERKGGPLKRSSPFFLIRIDPIKIPAGILIARRLHLRHTPHSCSFSRSTLQLTEETRPATPAIRVSARFEGQEVSKRLLRAGSGCVDCADCSRRELFDCGRSSC